MTTTPQSPVEIDTELARIWGEANKLRSYLQSDQAYLVCLHTRNEPWNRGLIGLTEERIADHQAALAELEAKSAVLEAVYNAKPWKRYFLVTNANGHVHRGMDCSTCFHSTLYAWLPELSDCDEAAMIEEFGEKACTVCFPTAPANPAFHRPGRRDAAAKAERQAEKDRKAAEKAAKAITAPDGSPLRVNSLGFTETIRTKVAARNALSSAVQSFGYYGQAAYVTTVRTLVEALEAVGIATGTVIERAAAKALKEGADHDIRKVLAR